MKTPQRTGSFLTALALALVAESPAFALSGDLQGLNKTDTTNANAAWTGSVLRGWGELDMIPCRILLEGPANNSAVTISFPKTRKGLPAFDNLYFLSNSPNITVSTPVLNAPADSDEWSYTFNVTIDGDAPACVYFNARLGAGVQLNPGAALQLRGEPSLSPLQIHKPRATHSKPDLGVKVSGPAQAFPGETVTYTLQYNNSAIGTNDTAHAGSVTVAIPEGLELVSSSPTAGVEINGNKLTWHLGDLAPEATGQMSWQAVISRTAPVCGVLTTSAAIKATENDLHLEDNMASAHTIVGSAKPSEGGELRITRIAPLGDDAFQIYFQTMPGRFYSLQSTEDFETWTTDLEIIPGTGTEVVSKQQADGTKRFYRVMQLP